MIRLFFMLFRLFHCRRFADRLLFLLIGDRGICQHFGCDQHRFFIDIKLRMVMGKHRLRIFRTGACEEKCPFDVLQVVSEIVLIGSQIVTSLQQIVSRRLDPTQPAVISTGSFVADNSFNVIAGLPCARRVRRHA